MCFFEELFGIAVFFFLRIYACIFVYYTIYLHSIFMLPLISFRSSELVFEPILTFRFQIDVFFHPCENFICLVILMERKERKERRTLKRNFALYKPIIEIISNQCFSPLKILCHVTIWNLELIELFNATKYTL